MNEPTEVQQQPRTSVEKVLGLIEELNNATPEELAQIVPAALPAGLVKIALVGVVQSIPEDPARLDAQLEAIATRLMLLRTDDAAVPATNGAQPAIAAAEPEYPES